MTARIAVYAGTFDPITHGHVDIIRRATHLFDQVIVGVATSARKSPLFNLEKRMVMATAALQHCTTVVVKELPDVTIDFAQRHLAQFLVRGLRSALDYTYEADICEMNRALSSNTIETVFLTARPEYAFISSSIVRELILIKAFDQVAQFVPQEVMPMIDGDR